MALGIFDAFSARDENARFEAGNRGYQRYARNAASDIKSGTALGVDALGSGKAEGMAYLDKAVSPWQQLSKMGKWGIDSHRKLLENPDSIFDSELYRAREAAGVDAINRGANARGMLASGNNTQDILDYMKTGGLDYFTTLANQYQPYFGLGTSGAAGQSGVRTAQANLASGAGANIADLYQNQGNSLADINLRRGGNIQDMNTNMANAASAADSNRWGALLGVGNMVAGGLGSYVGAGGRF